MKFVVVASKKDLAGKNIYNHLTDKYPSIDSYIIEEDSIFADNLGQRKELKDYDFIIFATRHKSEKGKPSLTVHAPGNWGEARFGGEKEKVCNTSARFIKCLFNSLNTEAKKENFNEKYEITLEVTHHGPTLKKPCCFIEIGSSEKEWNDKKAGEIIASSIKEGIDNFEKGDFNNYKAAIGIGGPHYAPGFSKIQLNSEYAISHIIPQYVFPINKNMIEEAINKTQEKVELAIIDWKGLKSNQRKKTIKILKEFNLDFERRKRIPTN